MGFGRHVETVEGSIFTRTSAERLEFIRKTYLHLFFAIAAFVFCQIVLHKSGVGLKVTAAMFKTSWLLVLGAFMLVGYVADRWANSDRSPAWQYAGLVLYVIAESFIFLPLMYFAAYKTGDASVLPTAAILTLTVFSGLTLVVFVTGKDFSFMRGALMIAGFAAMGLIVASVLFGFSLGVLFSFAMAALASGYVLYYTSNVLHHYRPGQHVAASLALFSAIALLFWYILQLLMNRD